MHEISIAQSLIELVLGHLATSGITDFDRQPVSTLHVRVGVLSSIVPAALKSAFRQARTSTALAMAELNIETLTTVTWCTICNSEKRPLDPRRLRCPDCGARTPEIRHGLELELVSIELHDCDTEESHAPDAGRTNADTQEERCGCPGTADSIP